MTVNLHLKRRGNREVPIFPCRHLTLEYASSEGLAEPIKTKESHAGYFVISIRSPSLSLEQAKGFTKEIHEMQHYAVMLGEPVDRRTFIGRSAVYVHSQIAEMSDKLNIKILK